MGLYYVGKSIFCYLIIGQNKTYRDMTDTAELCIDHCEDLLNNLSNPHVHVKMTKGSLMFARKDVKCGLAIKMI